MLYLNVIIRTLPLLLLGYIFVLLLYVDLAPKLINFEKKAYAFYYSGIVALFITFSILISAGLDLVKGIIFGVISVIGFTIFYGRSGLIGPAWFRNPMREQHRWENVDSSPMWPMDPYQKTTPGNYPSFLRRFWNNYWYITPKGSGIVPLLPQIFIILLLIAATIYIEIHSHH
jgi:hypothetical protein